MENQNHRSIHDALVGCVLGTAVGDAIGLPYEGLTPRRARRMFGPPDRHRFFVGYGMVSDDTDHTCMVAQALTKFPTDVRRFEKNLAGRLRWWLASLPAGTGLATARAILKLWIGLGPRHSGVFSAGNGPSMRSAVLGVAIDDPTHLREYVKASTRLTHTDPKAEWGALAVALAARMASQQPRVTPAEYQATLQHELRDAPAEEFLQLISQAIAGLDTFDSTPAFAAALGMNRGVSGYVYQTVPVAIHAWLRHQQDYRASLMDIIACGGDADTTAAIVGGIVGAGVGKAGIPVEWLSHLGDWPRTVAWMERLADALAASVGGETVRPPGLFFPAVLLRNLVFLVLVLGHGFRRLLPPY